MYGTILMKRHTNAVEMDVTWYVPAQTVNGNHFFSPPYVMSLRDQLKILVNDRDIYYPILLKLLVLDWMQPGLYPKPTKAS